MGHLAEKYDAAYFLCKDENGDRLPYGVEGIECFHKGELRDHDRKILNHVDFSGARVLEFGFGRGESIKYVWEQGAAKYLGVDFSEAACEIAQEFLDTYEIVGPQIVCADAKKFIQEYIEKASADGPATFDVVLMLDFVEHVPRQELQDIIELLEGILCSSAIIVVNTPDFFLDNDVIAHGLNEEAKDSSDLVSATRGMHCNRYTLESLRKFFRKAGFIPISRGHYFMLSPVETVSAPVSSDKGYRLAWVEAQRTGGRLKGTWPREEFEVAYEVNEQASLYHFDKGSLKGFNIYLTPSYLEYYKDGKYDDFLIEYLSETDLEGKNIFDLGGFVGVNSMQFARLVGPMGRVCVFEPNPFNTDRLKLNISENPGLDDCIELYPYAIADSSGKKSFQVHRNVDRGISSASYLTGAHTTLADDELASLGFVDTEVDVIALDDFVETTGIYPDVIKIDIEGSEHLALRGALKVLDRHHPILLLELHSIFCAIAALEIIHPIGYDCKLLHVEPDGRCFIGASAKNMIKDNVIPPDEGQSLRDAIIRTQQLEMECLMLREQVAIKKQECGIMVSEIQSLERKILAMEGIEKKYLELKDQYDVVNIQLQDQQQITLSLEQSLHKYQTFFPVRVARKLARIFRQMAA